MPSNDYDQEWRLTPEGEQFSKENMSTIWQALGFDRIVAALQAKFDAREWIVVKQGDEVEVYSVAHEEPITVLPDSLLNATRRTDNQMFACDSLLVWLALQMVAARDGTDDELSPQGLKMRKWLNELPLDSDVLDGSCADKFFGEQ